MNHRPFTPLLIALCLISGASARADADPFAPLTACAENQGGWAVNHSGQAKVFNEIRVRLGREFEKALLTYTDSDLDRIYWCGLFLTDADYLAGRTPLPGLALSLFEKGLAVQTNPAARDGAEMDKVAGRMTIEIVAAVLCSRLGQKEKAARYKVEVERLLEKYPVYGGAFPAMSEADRALYDSL